MQHRSTTYAWIRNSERKDSLQCWLKRSRDALILTTCGKQSIPQVSSFQDQLQQLHIFTGHWTPKSWLRLASALYQLERQWHSTWRSIKSPRSLIFNWKDSQERWLRKISPPFINSWLNTSASSSSDQSSTKKMSPTYCSRDKMWYTLMSWKILTPKKSLTLSPSIGYLHKSWRVKGTVTKLSNQLIPYTMLPKRTSLINSWNTFFIKLKLTISMSSMPLMSWIMNPS